MKKFFTFLLVATALLWPEGVLALRSWVWSVVEEYIAPEHWALGVGLALVFAGAIAAATYLMILSRRDPNSLPWWMEQPLSENPDVAAKQLVYLFAGRGYTSPVVDVLPVVLRLGEGVRSVRVLASLPSGEKRYVNLQNGTPCFQVRCSFDDGSLAEYRLFGSGTPFALPERSTRASIEELGRPAVTANYDELT